MNVEVLFSFQSVNKVLYFLFDIILYQINRYLLQNHIFGLLCQLKQETLITTIKNATTCY